MRGSSVDIDDICSMVQLDRELVEEVVQRDLQSDMVKVNQAMGEWYDGHGPFKEAENIQKGWRPGGNKQKGRKGDDELDPAYAKPEERMPRRTTTSRVAGRGEARSRGDGGRGRGRCKVREYLLQASERRVEQTTVEKGVGEAPAVQPNGASHQSIPEIASLQSPEPVIIKTFTSAKQPAISAWSRPKDWSELSTADSVLVETLEADSTPVAVLQLEVEQAVSLSGANALMPVSTRGDRSGRGRISSRDGGPRDSQRDRRHRDDAVEAAPQRGRGRGSVRREARGEQPSAVVSLDPNLPSESATISPAAPLPVSSSLPSMVGNAELLLGSNNLPLSLPLPTPSLNLPMTDLPLPSSSGDLPISIPNTSLNMDLPIGVNPNLLLSAGVTQLQNSSSSATALLAQSDPAILTVGSTVQNESCGSCSVAVCNACGALQPDNSSAVIMPRTLKPGGSKESDFYDANSKLQFGFGANLSKLAIASAPTAAAGVQAKSQLTFGAIASGIESICNGSSEIDAICASSAPMSSVLPLPSSLKTALPTASSVPLPGFCSASVDESKLELSIPAGHSNPKESPIAVEPPTPMYSNRKAECAIQGPSLKLETEHIGSNSPIPKPLAATTAKSLPSSFQQGRPGCRVAPSSTVPGVSSNSALLAPALLQSGMPPPQGQPPTSLISIDGGSRLAASHAPVLQSLSAAAPSSVRSVPPPAAQGHALESPGMGPPPRMERSPGMMPGVQGFGYSLGSGVSTSSYDTACVSDLPPPSHSDERRFGTLGQQPAQVLSGTGVSGYEPAPPLGLCGGGTRPGYDLPIVPVQGPPGRSSEKEPNRARSNRKKKGDRAGPPACDRSGAAADRGSGSAPHGTMMADSMIPSGLVVGNTMGSAPQGPMMGQPGMMPTQQFATMMPTAAMAHAMSFPCGNYGPAAGMVYAAPPGAGMYPGPAAGMYQPTPQYAPPQQFVAQSQSFVAQPQQPFMSQQTGSAATGYVYQQQPSPQQLSMPSGGAMGATPGGMGVAAHSMSGAHGMGVAAHGAMHTAPNFGYDESGDFGTQPGMYSTGAAGYYRPN